MTELESSCQQIDKRRIPHTNSAVCALGQMIYRALGKKMPQDHNKTTWSNRSLEDDNYDDKVI
jgi:hypothetical protein